MLTLWNFFFNIWIIITYFARNLLENKKYHINNILKFKHYV